MAEHETETLSIAAELRAEPEGCTITGLVVPFGVTSPGHRERFEPGSL